MLLSITYAWADPPDVDVLSDLQTVYIGMAFSDPTSTPSVARVFEDNGVTWAAVDGETDFDLDVTESYSGSIDTCWTYFDGTVYTGTTVTLSAYDYRVLYGCVIIKFNDNTYDYAGFAVHPSWDTTQAIHVGSLLYAAPSPLISSSLPANVQSVFTDVVAFDPDGSSTTAVFNGCASVWDDVTQKWKKKGMPKFYTLTKTIMEQQAVQPAKHPSAHSR